ncbi:MAG: phenylalanine--tRNA ligase subunit beta [Candidatus Ancillula sp.]|jgi:phenylalanyl-tRNA synthetase beta chain|nr:phenylalanine--tRNA ligase subunit beta [Candidatus Ancillula sp.]
MAFVDIEWLKDWVDTPEDLDASTLASDLVKVGLEEETIHSSGVSGPVVLGKVVSIKPEEQKNGKVINYCRVDVGTFNDTENDDAKELVAGSRGIICGAHNFKEDDHVVVALPGAILPGDFEIAARKTYGHISNGMICSARELGLGTEHDGIIVLEESTYPDALKVGLGEDIKDALGLSGEILEINITPDRGYCFSYRGVAREYALSTKRRFTDLVLEYDNLANDISKNDTTDVLLEDDAPINGVLGCTHFVAVALSGVDPNAQTPDWMQKRLQSAGQRSISLPVDITNYVMLHFGQPLHAYDADEVVLPIVVRRAKTGEQIKTLDAKMRDLSAEDLLITDSSSGKGARAIGVAGVMGGFETEVTAKTTRILLESAYFEPVSISRSARFHKLPSEASKRFERGVDTNLQAASALFAAKLLEELAGAKIESFKVSTVDDTTKKSPIYVNHNEFSRLTGVSFEQKVIDDILQEIGCKIEKNVADGNAPEKFDLAVMPPTWRPDLTIPADLAEECIRIYGYDKLGSVLPLAKRVESKQFAKTERNISARERVSNSLVARGFTEVLSYPFVESGSFEILNPLAGNRPFLRETLLETLLETASLNVRRSNVGINIFEVGRVFRARANSGIPPLDGIKNLSKAELGQIAKSLPDQPYHLAGVIAQSNEDTCWAKAINEAQIIIREIIGQGDFELKVIPYPETVDGKTFYVGGNKFHPTRCALLQVNNSSVGVAGELEHGFSNGLNLPKRASAFEVNLDSLSKFISPSPFKARPVSLAPIAREDYAFVVDENILADTIEAIIRKAITEVRPGIAESVSLFDMFTGGNVANGKKSLSFAVTLRGAQTLSHEDISLVRENIIQRVRESGGELRA